MGGSDQDSWVSGNDAEHELKTELERMVDVAEMRGIGSFEETEVLLRCRRIELLTEQVSALQEDELELLSNGVLRLDAELQKSRDRALELAQSKSDFLTNMSDGISTPINGVLGMSVPLLTCIADDVPQWVLGDPGRIRQLLLNVLGNAVKFTEDGSVRLRATCQLMDGQRCRLSVYVEDSGVGIALERREAIFGHFTQAVSGSTRRFGGTGMGLSVSQKLAELMAGTI